MRASPCRIREDPDRWLILAATLAWASLLVVYTVLTPVWRSPDETNHFDLVLDVSAGRGYAAWDGDSIAEAVLESSEPVRTAPPRVPIEPGASPPPLPPIEDTGEMSGASNHMTQHPPAYYELLGVELGAARAIGMTPSTVTGQLAVARVLSAMLLVPLPFLAWLLARTLAGATGVRRLALVLPLAVPGLAQVGSGVTNDALSVLVLSVLAVVLAVYRTKRDSLLVCCGIGALCGLALLTKAFGAAAVVWAGLVVLAGLRREGARHVVQNGLVVGVVAFVTGGWWYLKNLVQEGRILPSLEEARFSADSILAGSDKSFGKWTERFWPVAGRGFFGLFGYADVAISDWVYRVALGVALVGGGWGIVVVWRRRGPIVLLVSPLPILLLLQASQSYRIYERSGVMALGHGRYLLPAVVPCVVLVAMALGRGSRWDGWRLAPVVLGLAVFVHLHASSRLLAFYWADEGGTAALRVAIDWSPLPRVGSVGAVTGMSLFVALLMVLLVRRPSPPAPATAGSSPLQRGWLRTSATAAEELPATSSPSRGDAP